MMVSNLILQRLLSNLLWSSHPRRLAVSGFKDRPTVIEFSRVDNPDILEEEAITEEEPVLHSLTFLT